MKFKSISRRYAKVRGKKNKHELVEFDRALNSINLDKLVYTQEIIDDQVCKVIEFN